MPDRTSLLTLAAVLLRRMDELAQRWPKSHPEREEIRAEIAKLQRQWNAVMLHLRQARQTGVADEHWPTEPPPQSE